MSSGDHDPSALASKRLLAERLKLAKRTSVDLDALTRDEIHAIVYELEVHKIELDIQNEQLRAAQRAAHRSNERYLRLYNAAPIGYLTLDVDGKIVEANQSAAGILRKSCTELIGDLFSTFLAVHCQDRWHLARHDLIHGLARMDLTLEVSSAENRALDLQIVGVASNADEIDPKRIHVALIDMTELRRTERALQGAVVAATAAEERERRNLAADLHDDVGQLLALASLRLHALDDAESTERDGQMADLENLLAEIRRRVSSLSFQLSPPLLHDVGLTAALRWLAEDLKLSHGLDTTLIEKNEFELDEHTRVTFYRAVRELLLNVVKHSGVKQARVVISREGEMAQIAVEDCGIGMPPRAKRYGFGLLAMRERVEQLGGWLETRSASGKGTTVEVGLPAVSAIVLGGVQ
jgi:signal transduction histidine kinase